MRTQASRPTTPTVASPVTAGRSAPVGILARLDPDDLHPALFAGPHAWHPWQLTTRPPDPGDLRLVLPPRYPNQRAQHLLDHLADRLDQPIWPPQPALTIRRDRLVLHARDTTGWHATIRIDPASGYEVNGARGRGAVVDRDGWPILNELDALNDRCNSINPAHPTRQDLADLANWVRTAAARPADTRRVTTPLDRLLHLQASAIPQTASRLATITAALPADCTVDADALGHLHHRLQHALAAAASRTRRR
jgi:hypothetical protein